MAPLLLFFPKWLIPRGLCDGYGESGARDARPARAPQETNPIHPVDVRRVACDGQEGSVVVHSVGQKQKTAKHIMILSLSLSLSLSFTCVYTCARVVVR
jgi:hypothetical protein